MKKLIEEINITSSNIPRKIFLNKVDFFDERKIAKV